MKKYMQFYGYLSLISSLGSFFLGTVIVMKNPKQLENKIFSALCYLVFFLALVEFFLRSFENYRDVIIWNKAYALVAFIPCLLLHFVLVINEKINDGKNTKTSLLIYSPGLLLFGLGTFTDLFGTGFQREYWGWIYGVDKNILYVFFLVIILIMIYCLVVCIQNYKTFLSVNKNMQIRFISIAILIEFVIFTIFETKILETFNFKLPGLTLTGFSIFCVIIAYSMLRYGLFLVNYQDLVETSTRGFLEIDVKTNKLKYINPILLKIIGYSSTEFKKLSFYQDIIHPEDVSYLLQNQESRSLEFRVISKEGIEKWLAGEKIINSDNTGELISLRFWLDDVTENKNLEILKEEFLRRASHELKTPLISIKGFAELILTSHGQNLDTDVINNLNEITWGCNRLHSIVQDLIKSSQLEVNIRKKY